MAAAAAAASGYTSYNEPWRKMLSYAEREKKSLRNEVKPFERWTGSDIVKLYFY